MVSVEGGVVEDNDEAVGRVWGGVGTQSVQGGTP